jgi:hypothetical protein
VDVGVHKWVKGGSRKNSVAKSELRRIVPPIFLSDIRCAERPQTMGRTAFISPFSFLRLVLAKKKRAS